MSNRRAVCVGINDYPGGGALNGAVADARAWAGLLGERFGFAAGDVQLLLDRQASAAAIRSAMAALVAGAGAGDSLVLVLAGHGSMASVAATPADAAATAEPVFCPVDLLTHRVAMREVLDLGKALPRGAHLSVVVDASFAVTITRSAVTEDEISVAPGSDVRRRSLFPAAFRAPMGGRRLPAELPAPPAGMVMLMAAGAHECAHEGFFRRAYRGACSWHATEWLRAQPGAPSWRALGAALHAAVPAATHPQCPVLLGRAADLARPVFFTAPG